MQHGWSSSQSQQTSPLWSVDHRLSQFIMHCFMKITNSNVGNVLTLRGGITVT